MDDVWRAIVLIDGSVLDRAKGACGSESVVDDVSFVVMIGDGSEVGRVLEALHDGCGPFFDANIDNVGCVVPFGHDDEAIFGLEWGVCNSGLVNVEGERKFVIVHSIVGFRVHVESGATE
jgi:hypothetical protein